MFRSLKSAEWERRRWGVVMKRSDRELDLEQKREREEEARWRAEGGAFGVRRKRAFPASVCLWILFETLIIRASAGNCAILVLYGKVNAAERHASNFNAPSESKRRSVDSGGWKIWISYYIKRTERVCVCVCVALKNKNCLRNAIILFIVHAFLCTYNIYC